jgi:hypothetical protein
MPEQQTPDAQANEGRHECAEKDVSKEWKPWNALEHGPCGKSANAKKHSMTKRKKSTETEQ